MSTTSNTQIDNFNIVTSNTATSFTVSVISVELFTSANLRVMVYDANNNLIQCNYLTMSGSDYTNWSNNDEYVITFVANYYGFTLK
jgi:hypothetical protein